MLIVYAVSAIVAGALVVLSLFGTDHGDHELHAGDASGDHDGHWIPFLSLRFYTYFFAAFGITGLLLHFFTDTNPTATAIFACVAGFVTGLGIATAVRLLRLSEVGTSVGDEDVVGKEAQVLVPIRGTQPGRIRCSVRGDLIDFIAVTDEPRAIEAGETVLVVAMDNGRAQVMACQSVFGDDSLPQRVS